MLFQVVLFWIVQFWVVLFWVVIFRVVLFRVVLFSGCVDKGFVPDDEGAKVVEDHVVLSAVVGHVTRKPGNKLQTREILFRVVLFRVELFRVVLFEGCVDNAPDDQGAEVVEDHVVLRAVVRHVEVVCLRGELRCERVDLPMVQH